MPFALNSPLSPAERSASKRAANGSYPAEQVVLNFLQAIEEHDHELIAALLAPDLRYTNVSLPTIKGGKQVSDLFKRIMVKGLEVKLHVHELACSGNTVMTERTDVFKLGPFHMQFWVFGNFHVENGRITLWRDYFDWLNITKGLLGGLAGIPFKGLRNKPLLVP